MWHASIGKGGAEFPAAPWKRSALARTARELAMELLAGVGNAHKQHWMEGERAFHLRRKLTEAELSALSPDWIALPAIDPGGE